MINSQQPVISNLFNSQQNMFHQNSNFQQPFNSFQSVNSSFQHNYQQQNTPSYQIPNLNQQNTLNSSSFLNPIQQNSNLFTQTSSNNVFMQKSP
jgi:hypothetical protein